jgi:hypothetical protein
MCQQKNSDEASPREEVACLDCPLTKIQPEMCSQRLIELSTITNGWTSNRCCHRIRWIIRRAPMNACRAGFPFIQPT